jgi:polyhydroxyalkanoate synthesis regulator phasin
MSTPYVNKSGEFISASDAKRIVDEAIESQQQEQYKVEKIVVQKAIAAAIKDNRYYISSIDISSSAIVDELKEAKYKVIFNQHSQRYSISWNEVK